MQNHNRVEAGEICVHPVNFLYHNFLIPVKIYLIIK